jgi:hypothetical protein
VARVDSLSGANALATALETLAHALVHTDVDQMLACEAEIETALAQLPCAGHQPKDVAALMRELDRARTALVHCQRLGHNLLAITSLSLAAQGRGRSYGRGPNDIAPGSELSLLDTTA